MSKTRHILMLSGGKDSTALAIYMRDRVPEMEYVFCDTDKELSRDLRVTSTKIESFARQRRLCGFYGTTGASTTGSTSLRGLPAIVAHCVLVVHQDAQNQAVREVRRRR